MFFSILDEQDAALPIK